MAARTFKLIERTASLSADRVYRYSLWRRWAPGETYAMFIGLNPSTADETADDPTIRRCIGYAHTWGYPALCMTNLFAFRATQPRDMLRYAEPVGRDNDSILLACAGGAGVIVAAWGAHGSHRARSAEVRKLIPNLSTLRLTRGGEPGHPLYLPAALTPVPWRSA